MFNCISIGINLVKNLIFFLLKHNTQKRWSLREKWMMDMHEGAKAKMRASKKREKMRTHTYEKFAAPNMAWHNGRAARGWSVMKAFKDFIYGGESSFIGNFWIRPKQQFWSR